MYIYHMYPIMIDYEICRSLNKSIGYFWVMIRNCFTYVIDKMKNEDGYILIRRSRLNQEYDVSSKWHPISWLPHFLHRSNNGVVTQYTISDEQLKADHSNSVTYFIKYLFGSLLGMLFFILICINIIVILLFSMFWSFNGKIKGDEIHDQDHATQYPDH